MADETTRELKDAEREFTSILSQLSNQYKEVDKETAMYKDGLESLRETSSRIAVAQQALINGQTEYKNANGKTVRVQQSLQALLKRRAEQEAELNSQLRSSIVTVGQIARVDQEQMSLAKQEMVAKEASLRQKQELDATEKQMLAQKRAELIESRGINTQYISAQQGLIAGIKMYKPFSGQIESNTVRTDYLTSEYKRIAAQLKGDYDEVSSTATYMAETQTSLAENARRILVARQALEKGDEEYINASGQLVNVEKSLTGLLNERIGIEQAYHSNMVNASASLNALITQEKADADAKKAAAEASKQAKEEEERHKRALAARRQGLEALGRILTKVGQELINFVDAIYKVQQDVGIQMGSATNIYANALISRAKSLVGIGGGPILNVQEIVDATANFKKEFGTILDPEEAARIAGEAKRLGVSSADYVKAKRAFLGTGANEDVIRQKAIQEFKKQGLAGADAIQFAAQNADLLAVAGGKYAESLFRAAAESKKIGVNLRDIEKFANSIVGDFEGSLENFAELSALGVEMDFNQLAQVAATGTPEEMQNLLQDQLSQAGITGEELQRNRQLRLALTQTTGFDESTLLKLAGVAQAPTEKTVEEQQVDLLSKVVERLAGISTILLGIAGIVAFIKANQAVRNLLPGTRTPGVVPPTPPSGGPGLLGRMFGPKTPTPAVPPVGTTPPIVPPPAIPQKPTTPIIPPTPGGVGGAATPPSTPAGGANLAGTASGATSFSQSKVIQGAAAMLIVAASIYVLGKALQQFNTVEFASLGKAGLVVGAVGAAVALAGPSISTGLAVMSQGFAIAGPLIAAGLRALANPMALVGLAAVTISVIGLATALRIASPAFVAFGSMIKSVFEGIATIIATVVTSFGNLTKMLSGLDAGNLALVGGALIPLSLGITALGAAGLVASPGLLALSGVKWVFDKVMGPATPEQPTTKSTNTTPIVTTTSPTVPQSRLGETPATVEQKTPQVPPQTLTKIDTSRLEEKLDKLINSMRGMKVEMNGYEVGHISHNEARSPLRTR